MVNYDDYSTLVGNVYKMVGGTSLLTIDSVNTKTKTFIGVFADGKSTSMQVKSLKDERLWEYVGKKEDVFEPIEPKIMSNPVKDVKPKSKPLPKRRQTKKKEKERVDPMSTDFCSNVLMPILYKYKYAVKTWENVPGMYIVLNSNGKGRIEVYAGRKRIKIRAYSDIVPSGVEYKKTNYFMDATILLEYNEDAYKILENLISLSVEYKKPRKQSKKED